jgi:acyl carrier protein
MEVENHIDVQVDDKRADEFATVRQVVDFICPASG